MDVSRWPFVNDVDEQFYFKPEAGALFLSPADETPIEPSDAQPDEWDIAAAVERVEAATTLPDYAPQGPLGGACAPLRPTARPWSASRTAPGFFWLAGQGGYGIQTAPALSRAAAALILGAPLRRRTRRACAPRSVPARFAARRLAVSDILRSA